MPKLFTQNLDLFRQETLKMALSGANAIPKTALLNPNHSGYTNGIETRLSFDVAVLDPASRSGKKSEREKTVNDYGERRIVKVPVVNVSIPYQGAPKSFTLSPSGAPVIMQDADVLSGYQKPGALVVTFDYDDNLDRNVDTFVAQVTENLNRLREQIPPIFDEIRALYRDAISKRVEERRKEIEADKRFSFPVTD